MSVCGIHYNPGLFLPALAQRCLVCEILSDSLFSIAIYLLNFVIVVGFQFGFVIFETGLYVAQTDFKLTR